MKKQLLIYSRSAFLFTVLTPVAGAVMVTQKDKKFSVTELNLKVGEAVTFKNDDVTPHNVFSSSAAMKFNLKVQLPGVHKEQVFDKPGIGEIRCAIHPTMKIKVSVSL